MNVCCTPAAAGDEELCAGSVTTGPRPEIADGRFFESIAAAKSV